MSGGFQTTRFRDGARLRMFSSNNAIYLPAHATPSVLLHFDGADGSTTINDESGRIWTPFGNAKISTAQSQFGGSSLLLDGAGDYLSTPHDLALSANGDFSMACFVRPSNVTSLRWIAEKWTTTVAAEYRFFIDASGKLSLQLYASGGTVYQTLTSSTALALNTWAHVAWERESFTYRLYVNGVMEASAAPANVYGLSTNPLVIGRNNNNTPRDYAGYIDEFIVVKGQAIFRGNFTPPTAPYPYP